VPRACATPANIDNKNSRRNICYATDDFIAHKFDLQDSNGLTGAGNAPHPYSLKRQSSGTRYSVCFALTAVAPVLADEPFTLRFDYL
jgi:hypothetical protein